MSSHLAGLDAAAAANERYRDKHGHEDPAYLGDLLEAAHRQVAAARKVAKELYERLQAATVAEWATITDAEILASEHLRRRLVGFADRERWASDRLRAVGPKCPIALTHGGGITLHDEGEGDKINWMPTFEFYTVNGVTPTEEQVEQTAEAIRELGRLWAFGRRLLKLGFLCPDLGQLGTRVWIEYEPETEQGRVMTKDSRYSEERQLVYGPVVELVSAAIEHVGLLERMWDSNA